MNYFVSQERLQVEDSLEIGFKGSRHLLSKQSGVKDIPGSGNLNQHIIK